MKHYDRDRAHAYFVDKTAFTTGTHEFELLINGNDTGTDYQVVDVRYPADFALGHISGAINLPRGRWRPVRGLDREATLYVYCYNSTCHLAAEAAVEFVAQGYRVVEVEGGWENWVQNGFGIEVTPKSA
jgi:rhodanese-related sulfurtransferase